MNKNFTAKIIAIVVLLMLILGAIFLRKEDISPVVNPTQKEESFDYKIIKRVNKNYDNNYMISPMSIAYALSILKEGAGGNTKKEIEKLLGNYKLSSIVNIKDRVSLANALFIKNDFDIKDDYVTKIQNNYNSDLIYDEFTSPDKINSWVNDKTFGMIPEVIKNINPRFKLGIANALAIDVEWESKFECINTKEDDFTLTDGTKMKSPFMHSSNDVKYFDTGNAKGIVKDYAHYNYKTGEISYDEKDKDVIELEYIAILPNNLNDYVNKFDLNELNKIQKNLISSDDKTTINLSIPKYTYSFDYEKFKSDLEYFGIHDAFDNVNANFKHISDDQIYVEDAIHKTHIELSEEGTKAAAVTIFMLRDNAMFEVEKKVIDIKFDKPFIYIIKEKNNNNIWFFGTVYTPLKMEDNNACEIK